MGPSSLMHVSRLLIVLHSSPRIPICLVIGSLHRPGEQKLPRRLLHGRWLKRGNGCAAIPVNSLCGWTRRRCGNSLTTLPLEKCSFPSAQRTTVTSNSQIRGLCSSAGPNNQVAAQEPARDGPISGDDGTVSHRIPGWLAPEGGNTVFQSCFMSTTIQPLRMASSKALLRVPT